MIHHPDLLVLLICLLIVATTVCLYLLFTLKQKKMLIASLQSADYEFQKFLVNTPNEIVRYDKECRRTYLGRQTGYYKDKTANDLLGKTPSEFPGGRSAIEYEERIRDIFKTQRNTTVQLQWQIGDGKNQVHRVQLLPEFDAQGEVVSVFGVGQDITELFESRQDIRQMAYFDQLTHLPNRFLMIERIKQTIAVHDKARDYPCALLVLDIDEFKEINDLFGYATSDLLICEVATRLKSILQEADTLARLGGDEFAILIPQLQSKAALASISDQIMGLFSEPFYLANKELLVTISMGVALFPDDAKQANQLLNYADTAMYHAKKLGRNNTQFYLSDMTSQSLARTELDAALRKAVIRDELELYYQPQVDLATKAIIGAEALLRWQHPTLGMLTPDKFISLAEETGLIIEIGAWVLETACKATVIWNNSRSNVGEVPFRVAVNLSARQFIRHDLVGSIKTILADTDCRPEWIKLEITESLLIDETSDIFNKLSTLNEMGLDISIDDFGTGYSALGYLTRYPISQIKIDRSFITDIPIDLEKSALVKVLVQISRVLHLDLIAEGVETEEQATYLNANGCHTVQGYFFGKPMPNPEFTELLDRSNSLISQTA